MPSMWPVPCSVQRRCRPSSRTFSTDRSPSRPHSTSFSASTRWAASWKSRNCAAGLHGRDTRLLGLVHRVVDLPLERGEAAVDRQRPRHVGGVELVGLHARVEEQQLAGADRAVVADPVQRGGVRAGGADRAVADVVALDAGAQEEGALDVALAGGLGLVEDLHDVLEAAGRGVEALWSSAISKASLTRRASERKTRSSSSRSAVTLSVSAASMTASWPAHDAHRAGGLGQRGRKLADVLRGDAEQLLGLGEGVAAADPELALAVEPELTVLTVRAGQQVDRRPVPGRRQAPAPGRRPGSGRR